MDIDAFAAEHEPQWQRLGYLCAHSRSLSGSDADELVDLYQRASTQLATVRGAAYDPELEARLATLLANARAVITGSQPATLRGIGHFFGTSLPAALYRVRWIAIAVWITFLLVTAIIAMNVIQHPEIVHAYLTDKQIEELVNIEFAGYYTANPARTWALSLWLHNSIAAASVLMLGVLVIPALVSLYANALNTGVIGGLLIGHGRGDVFFGLLLPHAMLELTSFFFATAAGLRMGWAWIAPGARPRSRSLAEAGRQLIIVAIGCGLWLLVSGCIEAFVTPSGLPASVRIGTGFVAFLAFWTYVLVLGRRATRAGSVGEGSDAFVNATQPIEAAM